MPVPMSQQFDVFAQLVATGSIAAAARALDLPPATVVETMNRLEDRIGCQIFALVDGAVELTEAGRKVVTALGELSLGMREQWADALIQGDDVPGRNAWRDAGQAVRDDGQSGGIAPVTGSVLAVAAISGDAAPSAPAEPEAPVTPRHFRPSTTVVSDSPDVPVASPEPSETILLASHPSIFSHFQEALVAFEQASPDIGIALRLENIDEDAAARLFRNAEADIAYYYALGEPRHFSSRYAWSERISLFVGTGHPLARADAVLADDLAGFPYVALSPGNIARRLAEEALAQGGLETGEPALETDDLYAILKYVESNPAYFAAFGPSARDFGRMGGITRLAYAQGLPQIQVRQAVRPERLDDPAILALSEFLFR